MEMIDGYKALKTLEDITKAGETFTIAFFKYSRIKKEASPKLRTISGCRTRAQMPHEKWDIDGDNYFLFECMDGPKSCYKHLIRYIGFPYDNYRLKKVNWYNNEEGN